MAHLQRLSLTLRKRSNDREWRPVEVTEDPDDHEALREHLERLARDLDGRGGDAWWLGEYDLRVRGLDQEWRDFVFTGRAS